MPLLNFTLSPETVVRVHDAILCLARFSDTVGLEARSDRLILTALNISRSSHVSFTLDGDAFQSFYFQSNAMIGHRPESGAGRFTCQLYNRALLSVFRGRMIDARERDTSIERCEVSLQDRQEKAECRLIVKMICRHGVRKIYKLTYESVEVMHAVFDKASAKNQWSIAAHVLKPFIEHFGAKTEQLDVYHEAGRVSFTSYTEKIMDGNEILRQPLTTAITMDSLDFEDFSVEEKLHIGISVKDFKAIVTHAEILKATIMVQYSHPARPMQLTYREHGLNCAFTLMTIGEHRGGSVTLAASLTRNTSRPSTRQESARPVERDQNQRLPKNMPPPVQPASRNFGRESRSQRQSRPSPPAPRASIDHQSLFIPDDDDDSKWGEKNYDNEEDEDQLGWGASADNASPPYRCTVD